VSAALAFEIFRPSILGLADGDDGRAEERGGAGGAEPFEQLSLGPGLEDEPRVEREPSRHDPEARRGEGARDAGRGPGRGELSRGAGREPGCGELAPGAGGVSEGEVGAGQDEVAGDAGRGPGRGELSRGARRGPGCGELAPGAGGVSEGEVGAGQDEVAGDAGRKPGRGELSRGARRGQGREGLVRGAGPGRGELATDRKPIGGPGLGPEGVAHGARHDLPQTGGGLTLDELIVGVWEGLSAHRTVACPVCGAETMEPRHGSGRAPVGGRCTTCGTTIE
jgi:hypothetical protein